MHFGTWLTALRAKEAAEGVDHYEMACYASKLTPYVRARLAEAVGVLAKVHDCIPADAPEEDLRAYWEGQRDGYIQEIRGVLDVIGAALTAVGCTDKQLEPVAKARVSDNSDTKTDYSVEIVESFVVSDEEVDNTPAEPAARPSAGFFDGEDPEDDEDDEDDIETVQIAVSDVVQGVLGSPKK